MSDNILARIERRFQRLTDLEVVLLVVVLLMVLMFDGCEPESTCGTDTECVEMHGPSTDGVQP